MIGESTIQADALTKRYGDTTAVDELDLAIPSGATYGFLGPNGAGKTTPIEMLTTLISPTSGQAFIMGDSVADRDAVKPHRVSTGRPANLRWVQRARTARVRR